MEQSVQWEALGPSLSICVSPAHKFGTDAFLLSDFAAPRRKDLCCDLGTGCGIIPLLWFRDQPPQLCYGVDVQAQAVWQLEQTVRENGLHGRLLPLLADLKTLSVLPCGPLDLVTCNPPYKAQGSGILSETAAEKIARHEVLCTIEDVCQAAGRLLRFGGRLCLCQRPERLCDTLCAMREAGIEPKRLRFVQQRHDTPPWLFLVEGKKGSKPHITVQPPLLIEGEGGFSRELLDIYHKQENL
ncbi:MAG: methyltransferase [Oscillospiraceae bacterium]|nr:methyltransferase [Oscillospiraceae bacterium]